MTIQIDGSLINIVLPQEHLGKSRLSRASLTNQAKGSQMEEEVMSILEAGQESGAAPVGHPLLAVRRRPGGREIAPDDLGIDLQEGAADVLERIARHQGMATDDGQDAEEVIRSAVLCWRDGLSRWLGDRLPAPLDWDESAPAPCFTDKPGWDGYGGVLLLGAAGFGLGAARR